MKISGDFLCQENQLATEHNFLNQLKDMIVEDSSILQDEELPREFIESVASSKNTDKYKLWIEILQYANEVRGLPPLFVPILMLVQPAEIAWQKP